MAFNVTELFRGFFGGAEPDREAVLTIETVLSRFEETSQSVKDELGLALDRLSSAIGRCLEHRFLKLEWEKRASQALAIDPQDASELARQARDQERLHEAEVLEYRAAAEREEEVVRALEKRLADVEAHLLKIRRERDLLAGTEGLTRCRERIFQLLEELRSATGMEFLAALDTVRRQSERELALAEASEQMASDDRATTPKGKR